MKNKGVKPCFSSKHIDLVALRNFFFHMVVFPNKSRAFDQFTFFSVKSKIIMPRTFKEERGQAIGMLAAGGSTKEAATPF